MRNLFRLVWIGALLALVAVALFWWPRTAELDRRTMEDPSDVRLLGPTRLPSARDLGRLPQGEVVGRAGARRGTDVDGALPVDDAGHLIAAPDIIRFFDYFFLDSGEVADVIIRRRIEAEIAARLEEPALSEARALLEKYIAYRVEAERLYADADQIGGIKSRIASISALRQAIFGDAATALFGAELEYARVVAEIAEISADTELSEAERNARVRELEGELPEGVRAARDAARAPLELARDEAELRAAGGSAEEVRALREDRFGVAAANRLAELDRRKLEWNERIQEFRRGRSEIEADSTLDPGDRRELVAKLLADSFSETERLRVQALDRIELGR